MQKGKVDIHQEFDVAEGDDAAVQEQQCQQTNQNPHELISYG